MPSVEELLSIAETDTEIRNTVDSRIEIDADTRIIQMMPQDELFGVESDEKSERKYFKVPKIVGNGVDLSKLQLCINYQNASRIPSGKDMYIVTDATVYNDEWVYFSWELSRKVTQYKGNIYFVVCAVKADSKGNITNEWNTTLAEGKVLEGLEVEISQEQQYQASDYLEQLKQQLLDYSKEIKDTFPSDYTAMSEDVKNLKQGKVDKTEFVNTLQTIMMYIADTRIYVGLDNEDVVGIQVDYKNKTFKRLASATSLSKGEDFDKFSMFGGRKRCNVADDGSIVAWYGDADYKEDGSMGQVMVYQPKFYYLVCPVEYDPIDTDIGYHLRKANYYVSEKPRAGFRLHPAFYDANGNEIDYFLTSAYEGSIWDADGGVGGEYLTKDEQVMNLATDKFCSIAGVKPASCLTQNLTRPNIETLAQNRGTNWHGDLIKQVSAEQMLMIIEMGMMDLQTAIAQGVVTIADNSSYNCSSLTGSTSSLGNGTGRATETVNTKGDASTTETADGKTSICWRGKENFWGNIWKFVYGVNIWGNGKMGGGQPYICNDFNFAESKNNGNYEGAGFTATNVAGYISAMGYSTICDWLFIASECTGNSSLPVGDYTYITQNLNGYRIARLGGRWIDGGSAGAFSWSLDNGVGFRSRAVGGRLVYIPTRDSATYIAAIEAWKQKMELKLIDTQFMEVS